MPAESPGRVWAPIWEEGVWAEGVWDSEEPPPPPDINSQGNKAWRTGRRRYRRHT